MSESISRSASAGADPHLDGAASAAAAPEESAPRTTAISEDWAATIAGLVLLGLALAGIITRGMVP